MWTDNDGELFEKAIRAKEAGDLPRSIMFLATLTTRCPTNAKLHWYLGHIFEELGSVEKAIESFRTATRLAPSLELASLGLFHCLWRHDKLEEAFVEMRRFILAN